MIKTDNYIIWLNEREYNEVFYAGNTIRIDIINPSIKIHQINELKMWNYKIIETLQEDSRVRTYIVLESKKEEIKILRHNTYDNIVILDTDRRTYATLDGIRKSTKKLYKNNKGCYIQYSGARCYLNDFYNDVIYK